MVPADFDLNLLPVLSAVLTERSVTRAAERLHMSQSAVSHALRRLRSALDDELLVRVGNAMELTPEGERLATEVPALVERIERQISPETFDSASTTQAFVLALPDALVGRICPSLTERFFTAAPAARLVFRPLLGSVGDELAEGTVDAAIATAGSWVTPLHSASLLATEWHPVVAAEHPHRGTVISIEELAALAHVDTYTSFVGPMLEGALEARGFARRVTLIVPNVLQLAVVLPGTPLVGFAPMAMPLPSSLRRLRLDPSLVRLEYRLWWGRHRRRLPALHWFLTQIRAAITDPRPDAGCNA